MQEYCSNIWLWKEPDCRWKEEVISHIKNQEPSEADIVLLHCEDSVEFEGSSPVVHYIFEICQTFKIFDKKIMFLKPKDFFQALELCLERQNSENNTSEKEITEECVTSCYEMYVNSLLNETEPEDKSVSLIKKFMIQNNCIDLQKMISELNSFKSCNHDFIEYISKVKFLILGTVEMKIFKEFISVLANSDVVSSIIVETPLDISPPGSPSHTNLSTDSSKIHVSSESTKIQDLSFSTDSDAHLGSATEEYAKDLIIAFLSLLVNSRNELALSKVMISPFIDLSHKAFTHLKHLALAKDMPMCQTAISYVTRVRLGGKGYAPPADCPMLPHLKSLELFVDTLNQMQTIVEEESLPQSALTRLVNILKKKLIKCGSSKLKSTAIENVADSLNHVATKVLKHMKSKQSNSPASQVCQETLDNLYAFVNYINCSCRTFDQKIILKQKQFSRTPINLPPLLGYFRSPEEESTCEENPIEEEDSIISNNSSLGFPPPLMSYFHHSDNSCSASMTSVENNDTPMKTNFEDCIKETEEIEVLKHIKGTDANNRKRSILGNITNEKNMINENSIKKVKIITTEKKQISKTKEHSFKMPPKKQVKKTKLSKKFKLIEGQGKITNFLIVGKK